MQKKPLMGLAIALSFVCYLRPSECIRLMGASLVAPRKDAGPEYATWGLILHDATFGLRGKTGLTDESVHIDLDHWLWRPLEALHSARARTSPFGPSI